MPIISNPYSATQLINQSLGMIGLDPVADIEGSDRISTRARLSYVVQRDSLLRAHTWNCAVTNQDLNTITNTSDEFGYAFQLPTDPYCLRALYLEARNSYVIRGRILFTNSSAANLVYIGRIDAEDIDPMLYNALATRVAADLAGSLTRKYDVEKSMLQKFQMEYEDAVGVNESERGIYGRDPLIVVR
jgi:hypothetical protein